MGSVKITEVNFISEIEIVNLSEVPPPATTIICLNCWDEKEDSKVVSRLSRKDCLID